MKASLVDTWRPVTPEIAYRADIDGLRAVAVLSVIGFHAVPKSVTGGFIGVDIFFVISGYLISSLILGGLKNGSFSYLEFYARRVRRIFPALTVVLIFVWALGWFALYPANFEALNKHIVAGAAFAANIVTYFEVGYFDAPASTKPLLHLWSLGVEEQFYFVFPALLALVWRHKAANLILTAIAVASFALNVVTVRYSPSFAFYLPLTRFWEFLAGTLLAYDTINGWTARLEANARRGNAASAIGMVMIFGGIFMIPAAGEYPGWWALLPVVGTALIIWAGQQAWINRKILADQKLVFIGLISYPLYLWHWPLIVMGQAIVRDYSSPTNHHARTATIAAIVISFVLSWLTFEFVERPIRTRRPRVDLRRIATACAAALAAVVVIAFVTIRSDGFPERYPKEIRALLMPLTLGEDYPPYDEKKDSAGPLVVAYGDSHAGHLFPGLTYLQNERTFRYKLIAWSSCPPFSDIVPNELEYCRKQQTAVEEELTRLRPDIVVISAFWYEYKRIERLSQMLQFFQRIGVRRVVVLGAVPYWPEPPQALLYKTMRLDPLHRIPDRLPVFYPEGFKFDKELKMITTAQGATFVSVHDVFCNEEGCVVRSGDTARDIFQVDLTHFSAAGSWYLISHIADEIFNGISKSEAARK